MPEEITARPRADSSPGFLPQFEGLRGLAALSVVVAHVVTSPALVQAGPAGQLVAELWTLFGIGNLAVVFFFSLSAFLLTYLAVREFRETGRFSAARFYGRRILRIGPLYFCVVGVAVSITAWPHWPAGALDGVTKSWPWVQSNLGWFASFTSNWSLAFNAIGGHLDSSPGMLRILWSIGVEVQFYALFPLLMRLALHSPRARWGLCTTAVLLAWAFRAWFAGLAVDHPNLGAGGGMYYATLSYGDCFVAGGVAGWLAAQGGASQLGTFLRRSWVSPALLVATLAVARLWAANVWYPYSMPAVASYGVMGLLFALILLWLFVHPGNAVNRKLGTAPLQLIGAISFGIYLWHPISNTLVALLLQPWDRYWVGDLGFWAHLVLSLLAVVAFALASWFLLERPFLALRRRHASGSPRSLESLAPFRTESVAPLRSARPAGYWAWPIVLLTYVALYTTLLFKTDGYPYVLDNNESYSSLWHARSLAENGVAKTMGLTDEVFSTDPAASPYVHTHQGNFPRLYTFLLYTLGVHGIAGQIWITTFTVGLAGIWLAFRFLRRLGNPLFAALACLVMMTNYLLFAQWQVSLYNVWHVFFFFSSLTCVGALGDPHHPRRWAWLTLLNFAAFFYWEYVFTAFVAGLCVLYAAVLHWRRPRVLVQSWLLMGAGAAIAGGILLAQLTGYMGWSAVMEDVRLTLTARNAAADPGLLERVIGFYREHHVIFWHNFTDAAPVRTFAAFWDSITGQHLRYYTPVLGVVMLTATLGWLAGSGDRGGIVPAGRRTGAMSGLKWLALVFPVAWVLLPLGPAAAAGGRAGLVAALAAAALTCGLGRCWFGTWWGWSRLGWTRVIAVGIYCAATAWVLRAQDDLFGSAFQEELGEAHHWQTWRMVAPALSAAFVVLGLTLAVLGNSRMLGFARDRRLVRLPAFLLCCLLAYGAAYRVFTGYIYSGYLNRQVPLLVFVTDLLLALALYLVIAPMLRVVRRLLRQRARPGAAVSAAGLLALGGWMFVLTTSHWLTVQAAYVSVAPPDSYRFLSTLDRPEFRGRSLVSNTYPAPMAGRTQAWGYADTSIFSGRLRLSARGFEMEHDPKYLWMADAATNPAYRKPDLAIYVLQTPHVSTALQRQREAAAAEPDAIPPSEGPGLIQSTVPFRNVFLRHRLLYSDRQRVSIAKLDWDFPPYLQADRTGLLADIAQATLRERLILTTQAEEARRRWRISITPPLSANSGAPVPIRLLNALIDGQPVFTAQELRAAGWQPAPARAGEWIWSGTAGTPGAINAFVTGDHLSIVFGRDAAPHKVHVQINDLAANIDLQDPAGRAENIEFFAAYPYGQYAFVPVFADGLHVQTAALRRNGRNFTEISYRFVQQDGRTEANTILRLQRELSPNHWSVDETYVLLGPQGIPVRLEEFRRTNPDTVAAFAESVGRGDDRTFVQWLAAWFAAQPQASDRPGVVHGADAAALTGSVRPDGMTVRQLPLPEGATGRYQVAVIPGTRSKHGPKYVGLAFQAPVGPQPADAEPVAVPAVLPKIAPDSPLPFGSIRLRLRLPLSRTGQAEPLVTTGATEAGDFVFIRYTDAGHIQIGFDHWFRGGPATRPIAVDYDAEHELVISMGSLYPPEESVAMLDRPADEVRALKDRVVVTLDGRVVLDLPAETYESVASSVHVGRNPIRGTSSGPEFTGEILSIERIWPDIK